jgi:hypothetical protein
MLASQIAQLQKAQASENLEKLGAALRLPPRHPLSILKKRKALKTPVSSRWPLAFETTAS